MSDPQKIALQIRTQYLSDQSDPAQNRYVFTYTITIANQGTGVAQLISRHWIISDGNNKVQEVKGLGVIGHQPLLKPGERFEYTSGCVLDTPVGSMRGSYQMVTDEGAPFTVTIPEFVLAMPRTLH